MVILGFWPYPWREALIRAVDLQPPVLTIFRTGECVPAGWRLQL